MNQFSNKRLADKMKNTLLKMDRRSFLALLSFVAAGYPLANLAEKREQLETLPPAQPLDEPWRTLDAVQQHMLPAEKDSPGASDINAIIYLQNMLDAPDMDKQERDFISQGVGWLNDIARKQKGKDFVQLNETEREQVLRSIEQSRAGERWLSLMLSYLIEALLSDPVYGGNVNEAGWKWLEHQPGFPTPGPDKMYFKLARTNTFRRTRA